MAKSNDASTILLLPLKKSRHRNPTNNNMFSMTMPRRLFLLGVFAVGVSDGFSTSPPSRTAVSKTIRSTGSARCSLSLRRDREDSLDEDALAVSSK